MGVIQQALGSLQGTDLYPVVLPFVLIFAIVFGLLSKLNLFGDKSKPVNAVIGLTIAMYAVVNPTVASMGPEFVTIFGKTGLLLTFALVALLGAAMMGVTPDGDSRGFQALAALLALGLLAVIASTGALQTVIPGTVPGTALTVPAVNVVTAGILLATVGAVAYMVRA